MCASLSLIHILRLRRPHLAHTDDVGVVPQGHVQQHIDVYKRQELDTFLLVGPDHAG